MSRASDQVSDLALERYVAGDVSAEQRASMEARVAREPELAARVEALRRSNEEILRAHPVSRMGHAIRARAQRQAPARRPMWLLAAPMVAAAAVLVVWIAPGPQPTGTDLEPTRTKGATALNVYRQTGDSAVRLADGAAVRQGDLVQLAYVSGGKSHGLIVSIDGRGAVTLHSPASASDSTRLTHSGEVRLPRAYQLDDAPAFEVFVFVTADAPLDVGAVLTRARELASRTTLTSVPHLSSHGAQAHVALRKVQP